MYLITFHFLKSKLFPWPEWSQGESEGTRMEGSGQNRKSEANRGL